MKRSNPILQEQLDLFLDKLNRRKASERLKRQFVSMYTRFLAGETGQVNWDEVVALEEADFISLSSLPDKFKASGESLVGKLGIVKLNGGLGTTMGCQGPKSLIPIHDDQTFLDIIVDQIQTIRDQFGVKLPLILMNSPATSAETDHYLNAFEFLELLQNDFPRIDVYTKKPFICPQNTPDEWNPAGHGDFYLSLVDSGLIDRLIEQGIEYLFISNADNLGPSFQPKILGYMAEQGCDFVMETTPKTKLDVKGGTLIRRQNRLELLERAQVPDAHLSEFEDMSIFHVFNTNNIWVRLSAIKALYTRDVELPLIVNPKTIHGSKVVQLESAIGSAISVFDRAVSIIVGRDRFLPVKKTSDLLVIKSDLIQKGQNNTLNFGEETLAGYPEITLSHHFETMERFNQRIKVIPSLKDVTQLALDGDMTLGPGVVFKGNVSIQVTEGRSIYLEHRTFQDEHLVF